MALMDICLNQHDLMIYDYNISFHARENESERKDREML